MELYYYMSASLKKKGQQSLSVYVADRPITHTDGDLIFAVSVFYVQWRLFSSVAKLSNDPSFTTSLLFVLLRAST